MTQNDLDERHISTDQRVNGDCCRRHGRNATAPTVTPASLARRTGGTASSSQQKVKEAVAIAAGKKGMGQSDDDDHSKPIKSNMLCYLYWLLVTLILGLISFTVWLSIQLARRHSVAMMAESKQLAIACYCTVSLDKCRIFSLNRVTIMCKYYTRRHPQNRKYVTRCLHFTAGYTTICATGCTTGCIV